MGNDCRQKPAPGESRHTPVKVSGGALRWNATTAPNRESIGRGPAGPPHGRAIRGARRPYSAAYAPGPAGDMAAHGENRRVRNARHRGSDLVGRPHRGDVGRPKL